jgi:hypothetical protein
LLRSLLYFSNSVIIFSEREQRVAEIVRRSVEWNESVGITGALAFTEFHFVQAIEGPSAAIADLIAKLRSDRRHSDLTVIEDVSVEARRFGDWSLAYSGPDRFIDRDLRPILQGQMPAARIQTAATLRALLLSMASAS